MSATITYRIRHAEPSDLAACLDLRVKSAEALAAAGITQWHDNDHGRQVITGWIEQAAMHVVTTQAGDVAACFALAGADPAFWTPAEAVQPALYLYKFMIRADRRGTGLGELLLDWCAQRAAEVGARWLRLDCWRTNTALHNLWKNRGFIHLDTREHPVRNSGALFQRDAGTTLAAELHEAITLADDTAPARGGASLRDATDRYDPTSEAAIWNKAAELVAGIKLDQPPVSPDSWNTALDQAARTLENRGRAVRQASGMYHRVISA